MSEFPETIGPMGTAAFTPAVGKYAKHVYFIRDGEIVGVGKVHRSSDERVRIEPYSSAAKELFRDHYLMSDPTKEILRDYRYPTYWATTGEPTTTFIDEPEGTHMGTIVVGEAEYAEKSMPTETLWQINFKY